MCSQSAGIGLRAFARQHHVTLGAVQRAIRDGRLTVVRDARGRRRLPDEAQAAREWRENTLSNRRPVRSGGSSPKQSGEYVAVVTDLQKARLERQQFENARLRGTLVDVETVRTKMADVFLRCRTKLLAIASKAKLAIPHLTRADLLVVDGLVREALTELADDPELIAPARRIARRP